MAFALFEAAIVVVALCVSFGGFAVASVAILGPSAVVPLLVGIAMPAISIYLLASIGYLVVEGVLLFFGRGRIRGLVLPCLLAGALLASFAIVNEQSQAYLTAALAGRGHLIPQLAYAWLAERSGTPVAVAVFLVFCAGAGAIIGVVAPRSYVPVKRYYKLLSARFAMTRLGAHVLVLVRSFETAVVVLFTLIISGVVWANQIVLPPFALMLITFQGVYAFSNSEPLRRIGPQNRRPLSDYLCLIGSQALLLCTVGVPVGALAVAGGASLLATLTIAGLGLVNIVFSTLVGIAFPPEKGNPFSVLIGVVLMLVIVGVVAIGLNLFALPVFVNIAFIVTLSMVAAGYGVVGIHRIERGRRNEIDVAF